MPSVFAMNRCLPGPSSVLIVHDAFLVTVLPVEVT